MSVATDVVETKVPARMDRLPWSRWHKLMIASLGVVWILDGLEVTIKGSLGPTLKEALGLTTAQVGTTATVYLIGAVIGAAVGGYATDRWGRKRVFQYTILVYLAGVLGTGLLANGYVTFMIFRFITGLGIGGEYAGIHSAIDELLPARIRGRAALAINGSYWIGTLLGSGLATLYLNVFSPSWAWRAGFLTGASLALAVIMLRAFVPESPRWLMVHGRTREADEVVSGIERKIEEQTGEPIPEPPDEEAIQLSQRDPVGPIELTKLMFGLYPRRSALGGTLLATQAFLYNAIFFTYGLVLTTYFGVSRTTVGLFLIPFAIGNFTGPVLLGPLFDRVGRKPMISGTYLLSAGLLTGLAWVFLQGWANAVLFTLGLTVVFFFASAAASSGYMTVSETFPLEIRAQAIAFFYIVGTLAGGVVGPWLFGNLINAGDRFSLFIGYLIGSALMATGGIVEIFLGFRAEQRSLEDITDPLSVRLAKESEGAALHGPLGIDPTDVEAIRSFQQERGIDEEGRIGPRTQGAIRALLSDDPDADPGDMRIDITDPDSVRGFQERLGLVPSGEIGPETRGALLAVEKIPVIDPADTDSVEAFQRDFGLDVDGDIGRETQVALRVIRAERVGGGEVDVDIVNRAAIMRFQNRYGLTVNGDIGPETRGALKAIRALRDLWADIDLSDPDAVQRFQTDHGIEPDGVINDETRAAIADACRRRRERRTAVDSSMAGSPEFDPTEVASIRRFQRQHDLDASGIVDQQTRTTAREVRRSLVGVDPADPDSIRAFQRQHGLEPDGVVGPRTRGAMDAVRSKVTLPDPDAEPTEPEEMAWETDQPAVDLDPTDASAVRQFQSQHGLAETGIVDWETQVALRVVQIERLRQAHDEGGAVDTPPAGEGRPARQTGLWSGFAYVATLPDQDADLDNELAQIEHTLEQEGPLNRRQLRDRVGAARWGPGRFRTAFTTAVEEERIERDASGGWRPADRKASAR